MRFTSGSWKKLLLVAISGLSLLPAPALAEDAKGKFTLAREVRWGVAVLPAGDYRYTIEHERTVTLRSLSGGPNAIVLASSVSLVDSAELPHLMLKKQGNDWIVTSMVVGSEGKELYFTPSFSTASMQEARRPTKVALLSSTNP
ncbi:MAG TPA: hypothetical protein VLL05_10965 [Terriglobales bacterium]|nr:hypothetical protein [Terriglobales bacterium]